MCLCCLAVLLLCVAASSGRQPAAAAASSPPLLFPSWRRYNQSAAEERQRSRVADLRQFLAELRATLGMEEPKLYIFVDGTDRQKVDDEELFRAWAVNPATTFYVFEGGPGKGSPPKVETTHHTPLTAADRSPLTLPHVSCCCQGSAWIAPSDPDAVPASTGADSVHRLVVCVLSS